MMGKGGIPSSRHTILVYSMKMDGTSTIWLCVQLKAGSSGEARSKILESNLGGVSERIIPAVCKGFQSDGCPVSHRFVR